MTKMDRASYKRFLRIKKTQKNYSKLHLIPLGSSSPRCNRVLNSSFVILQFWEDRSRSKSRVSRVLWVALILTNLRVLFRSKPSWLPRCGLSAPSKSTINSSHRVTASPNLSTSYATGMRVSRLRGRRHCFRKRTRKIVDKVNEDLSSQEKASRIPKAAATPS